MNATNENFVSMAQTVQQFYTNNQGEADAALPALAPQMAELDSRVLLILQNAADADQDITGYAQQKQDLADGLIALAFKVGNACATYYTLNTPDKFMKERVDWAVTELRRMRDNDLYVACLKTWQVADPIKADLTDYAADAADVDNLATSLATYLDYIQRPNEGITNRSALKQDEEKMVSELRKFFREVLDQLFEPLAISLPLLYSKYRAARNIVDLPGGSGGTDYEAFAIVAAGTTINIPIDAESVSVSPSTPIKFFNTSEENPGLQLYFQFDTTPAAEFGVPGDSIAVGVGNSVTKTAAEAGFNSSSGSVYLNVRNASPSEQSYKIEI